MADWVAMVGFSPEDEPEKPEASIGGYQKAVFYETVKLIVSGEASPGKDGGGNESLFDKINKTGNYSDIPDSYYMSEENYQKSLRSIMFVEEIYENKGEGSIPVYVLSAARILTNEGASKDNPYGGEIKLSDIGKVIKSISGMGDLSNNPGELKAARDVLNKVFFQLHNPLGENRHKVTFKGDDIMEPGSDGNVKLLGMLNDIFKEAKAPWKIDGSGTTDGNVTEVDISFSLEKVKGYTEITGKNICGKIVGALHACGGNIIKNGYQHDDGFKR